MMVARKLRASLSWFDELTMRSGCEASEVLEAAEHALDDVAVTVRLGVAGEGVFAVGFVGDHRGGAACGDIGAQLIAVVGFVGEEGRHRGREGEHVGRGGDIGGLARREEKGDGSAERIGQGVDLCGATAARPSTGSG